VFGTHFVCGEEAEERSPLCGGLDCGASTGFFAFDNADYSSDDHACFACRFNRGDGGGAGCADVVDDDDVSAGATKAFDTASGAVGFLSFADKEAVKERCARVLLCAPCAGRGDVGDDGVGSHGEPADGFSFDLLLLEELEDSVAGKPAAFGVERSGAAIDVVVARSAGREFELAELEAGVGEEGKELLSVGHQK